MNAIVITPAQHTATRRRSRPTLSKGDDMSAWTARLRDELAAVTVTRPSARAAQVSVLARLAARLETVAGHTTLEFEVDRHAVAERWAADVRALYGHRSRLEVLRRETPTAGGRYIVTIRDRAQTLARQSGLLDDRGQLVRGLPSRVVGGSVADSEAALRAAFMVHGALFDPRRSALTVSCPTVEAGLALAGAARRVGIAAKTRDRADDICELFVRDADTIAVLLTRIGAPVTARAWGEARARTAVTRNPNAFAVLDPANVRRTRHAAAVAAARVERAFEILGDDVPDHLGPIGRLRVEHPQASLEQLGGLAKPPLTKDTTAGRLRRLLLSADTRAHQLGIADTTASIPDDLRD